jgi:hypothetical protein
MVDTLFLGLVLLDGWLTQRLFALGAVEANPNPFVLWTVQHLWVRALIAIAAILLLRFFDKWKLLVPLCLVWLCICIYNAIMLAVGNAVVLGLAIAQGG